jgi:sugar phosphate permease
VILSVIALFEALFYNQSTGEPDNNSLKVALTLYQMSSVFEAGVSLACIVIINNWFKENILGTVSALWATSIYL